MMGLEPFVVAAAVAVVAWAVAKEEILREPREWCAKVHRDRKAAWLLCKLAYVPTCEFCTSFWLTLLSLAVFRYTMIWEDWRGCVLAQFFTWAVAVAYLALFQLVRVDIRTAQTEAKKNEVITDGRVRA
jgi:hypothetical protein